MKQVKCPDCEAEYPSYLKSCPFCGCPNDHWEAIGENSQQSKNETGNNQSKEASDKTAQQDNGNAQTTANAPKSSVQTSTTDKGVKTDWANYVYECGLLFWHTFSRRYLKSHGRASRREFWSFNIILYVLLGGPIIYSQVVSSNQAFLQSYSGPTYTSSEWFILLVCFLPLLMVWIRRMHDIGKSGWWCLVPVANYFLALKKSDEGENQYGEPAKDDI